MEVTIGSKIGVRRIMMALTSMNVPRNIKSNKTKVIITKGLEETLIIASASKVEMFSVAIIHPKGDAQATTKRITAETVTVLAHTVTISFSFNSLYTKNAKMKE